MNNKLSRYLLILGITTSFMVNANTLDKVNVEHDKTMKAARVSQEKIDSLAGKTDTLEQEYRQLLKLVEDLKVYNRKLEIQIENQKGRLNDIEGSIANVQVIQRQIVPLMERMIDSLDEFIALDIPFHKKERTQRIAFLRNNLNRPDLSTAEKFRQVLEAYKIESEYGRKIDTYTDTVVVGGVARDVTILRVGRVAMLYQTEDMKHTGMWDKTKRAFVEIDPSMYRDAIRKGIRIANKQANIDILELPMTAPVTLEVK